MQPHPSLRLRFAHTNRTPLSRKNASELVSQLLALHPTPNAGVLPERAALARVDELKGRRDFASLVRDMDAFPECEELQVQGNILHCRRWRLGEGGRCSWRD